MEEATSATEMVGNERQKDLEEIGRRKEKKIEKCESQHRYQSKSEDEIVKRASGSHFGTN